MNYKYLREKLVEVAQENGEQVLETPGNNISIGTVPMYADLQ